MISFDLAVAKWKRIGSNLCIYMSPVEVSIRQYMPDES